MPKDKTNHPEQAKESTEELKSTISTDEIRQLTEEEQDKTFSTFESNRREKEKAEEMMPESFDDIDAYSMDESQDIKQQSRSDEENQ